jgi:hypothetical protein
MTFWQGLAITVLAETTDFGGNPDKSDEWAMSAQNFLICLEMLLFSIAHFYCFPVEEWQDDYQANYNKAKFGESLALNDFFTDLKLVLTADSGLKKNKKKNSHHKSKRPSEPTVPEGDEETVDISVENGDDRESEHSVCSSDDVEDPKRALINALEHTIEGFGGDNSGEDGNTNGDGDRDSGAEMNVREAQMRIGNMLGEMLAFSPRPKASKFSSSNSSSIGSVNSSDDDNNGNGKDEEDRGDSGGINSAKSSTGNLSDIEDSDQMMYNPATEETGLLTGRPLSSVTANLKPSIFTSIANSIDDSAIAKEADTQQVE